MARATMVVFAECNNAVDAGCTATVERTVSLNYQANVDARGFRPLTLTARAAMTRYQGRMVSTQSKQVVQLTGFDWAPEGMNLDTQPQKREGITASLFFDGRLNVTTFCKTRNTGAYRASGAHYYCNGWDTDEMPMGFTSSGVISPTAALDFVIIGPNDIGGWPVGTTKCVPARVASAWGGGLGSVPPLACSLA
jgi:hypothetical protein